jgi:molecular chaperone DnaK (HSP70)/HEAT repeat protein
MNHKLAIDFGTTNSVISRWNDETEATEVIKLAEISANGGQECPPLIPSLLYVQNGQSGQVVVGQAVNKHDLNRQKDNRLFRNFKRGLVTSSAPQPRSIDGALWTDREAGRSFVQHLVDRLPYPITEIEQLVLTAPVVSFTGYLAWLNEALAELNINDKIRIVDESTAAALGYAVTKPGAVVLVFDLGGGTLDLSLVQLPESKAKTGGFLKRLLQGNSRQHAARVIAKAGQVIGGSDIDQWLLADVLQRTGLSAKNVGDNYTHLLAVCEQTKIALSTTETVPLTFAIAGQTHTTTITRAELETLLEEKGFYTALHHVVDKVMHVSRQQGIFKEDVDYVLMVGGVSLMPSVQQLLGQYFGDMAIRSDKPFTAVAEGALQVAKGAGLDDYLVHSYGLRYLDPATSLHHYDEIIPMGTRYPTEKSVEVILAASRPDQTKMKFVLGQIDTFVTGSLEMAYEGGQAVFVARPVQHEMNVIPLNAGEAAMLAPLDPPGQPGQERLKARFTIDAQRHLRVTVTDLHTGRQILDTDVKIDTSPATQTATTSPVIDGREPALATHHQKSGWRLSGHGLAKMLNVLPVEAITLDAAAEALKHQDFYVRHNAATLLRKRGDREARLLMQEALTNGETRTRASVARQLHGFSWFAADPLLKQALQDPDLRVREAAIYALCDRQDPPAYQLMVESLQDEDDFVRAAATFGLRECLDPTAVPVLEAAMLAKDPEVRVKALDALSVNATPQAIPVIRQALTDPDPYVQYTAVMSLLELLQTSCLPELAALIKQTYDRSREHILRGFFQATNHLNLDVVCDAAVEQVFDALEIALQDDLPTARMAVMWPLAWLDHERARTLLTQAYQQEKDDEVKAHIIHVAVNLLSPLGKEFLEDGLRSESEGIREMAEQIKADIEAGAILVEW